MNPAPLAPHTLRTGRMVLTPVSWTDLADLVALKADPRVFAIMFGGVRTEAQAQRELAEDMAFWARQGCGMWTMRFAVNGEFVGMTGMMERADGRGIALRFAVKADLHGAGLAREGAGAALRFGHEVAGLERIIAVARESNFSSRTVLGAIGMVPAGGFVQGGYPMVIFESIRRR